MDISVGGKGPILGNPLRCLNCYSNSSKGDIQREYRDLMQVRLASPDQSYLPPGDPYKIVDSISVNRQMAQDAWDILSDPLRHIGARLLYLTNITAGDAEAIQCLRDGEYASALAIWKRSSGPHAFRNRTVSVYATVMAEQSVEPTSIESMERLWRDLYAVTTVESIAALRALQNTPAASIDFEAVRRICWEDTVKDCSERVSSWIGSQKTDLARNVQLGLEHSLADTDMAVLVNHTVSEHLDRDMSEPIRVVTEIIDDIEQRLPNISHYSDYDAAMQHCLDRLETPLQKMRDTIAVFQDRYQVLNYATEPFVMRLRALSITVHNEREDYATALTLLGHAKQMAMSTEMIERLRADELTIEHNQASSVTVSSSPAGAPLSLQTGSFKWGKFLWVGGLVLVFAAISLMNNDSNRSPNTIGSRETNSKPAYQPSVIPSPGAYAPVTGQVPRLDVSLTMDRLKARIDSGKTELLIFEALLDRMDLKLSELQSTISGQEVRLDQLESLYNSTGDDSYSSQYEALRLVRNTNVEEYNAQLLTRERGFRNYETLLESTNRLVNQYNNMLK